MSARSTQHSAALELGVVDALAAESDVLPTAMARAMELAAKSKPIFTTIWRDFYGDAIAALLRPPPIGSRTRQ